MDILIMAILGIPKLQTPNKHCKDGTMAMKMTWRWDDEVEGSSNLTTFGVSGNICSLSEKKKLWLHFAFLIQMRTNVFWAWSKTYFHLF